MAPKELPKRFYNKNGLTIGFPASTILKVRTTLHVPACLYILTVTVKRRLNLPMAEMF